MRSPSPFVLLVVLAACGGEIPAADAPRDAALIEAADREGLGAPRQLPRGDDPRLVSAVRLLEQGDLAEAGRVLLALPDGDLDARLLRARLASHEGDSIGAVRQIEAARAEFPDQARVYAVAGEIHAAAGRLESAEREIREGLGRCGPTPELSRARGVLAISREGGARVGLNHLLEARQKDPELPFLAYPLAQAHLLLSRQALAREELLDAVGHARAALEATPGDPEVRLLLSDALAAAGDLDGAVALQEELLAEGRLLSDSLALLCQRAATAALVRGERERAIAHHLRARELGLPEEELGFGRTLLAEESLRVVEEGLAHYHEERLLAAAGRFERALELDPESLAARNHLGVARFKLTEYSEAARHWQLVLDVARAEQIELPEPVHLNLARALALCERVDEARRLLKSELERDPEGPFAGATRELLAEL